MPVPRPPTPWSFPAPATWPAGEDLVCAGADLAPGTLVAAYAGGLFPMPLRGLRAMAWWSPDPRAVLPLETFSPSRSLRRSRRRFTTTVDAAFPDVVAACADPRRPHGWISPAVARAYERLHDAGWAHSVEAWTRDGRLAGGLYGVQVGGLFAAESKFHRETDASKVALAELVERLRAAGDAGDRLLDVQWSTPHLESLGVVELPRAEYLARLAHAVRLPPAL